MIISGDRDHILLLSVNGIESLNISPKRSDTEFFEGVQATSLVSESPECSLSGLPTASEMDGSPKSFSLKRSDMYTDVNVVSDQEKHELSEKMSNLEAEIALLRMKLKSLNGKRREGLNRILDIKGSIRVFCRVRPFLQHGKVQRFEPISVESEKIHVRTQGSNKDFVFDKVFLQDAKQDDVFAEVAPIVKSALDGHNVCVIAYGQTGTGKTFTMDGMEQKPGIVPRALKELFCEADTDNLAQYSFTMSMLEVYMGSLRDLLAPKPIYKSFKTPSRSNLNILTSRKGAVEIEGLTEVPVHNLEKATWWYNKGKCARSTAWTNVNEASSRSHCLMRIAISHLHNDTQDRKEVSKLWMIDLGGSERCLKTGATGQTLDEGRAINLSLSALGDVTAALQLKRRHVPYRNSKLTQILKDSLGVSSKVLMLVHVSPREEDVAETICSLSFAKRVRAVQSDRDITEDMRKEREKKIFMIEEEMKDIEGDQQKVKNQIKHAELLLSEYKKIVTEKYVVAETSETPRSITEGNSEEKVVNPNAVKRVLKRSSADSMPRFMTSTMASRQRQTASEGENAKKPKTARPSSRNSLHLMSSQSLSDIRLRIPPTSAYKKTRYSEGYAAAAPTSAIQFSKHLMRQTGNFLAP